MITWLCAELWIW